ncbi:hypothetical protein JCM10449v2_003639 [Rhodotorula kratochvilovae]
MPAPAGVQLPAVEFTVVHPPLASADVHQPNLAHYGYNTGHDWDHYHKLTNDGADGPYLRWLQPMEAELARQVEYDMDEQGQHRLLSPPKHARELTEMTPSTRPPADQLWLDALNADRKRDGLPLISYEVFEIIMDKIEKEWFDLTRNIPKRTNALPSEDSKCAICDDGECENANAIVFCDGCNLAVHQDCYGVPYIPEGQWLCRKCTVSPDKPVACVLCPRPYGAFKQTTTGQWAHLLCAIWIPDTSVSNTVYMEPVDGVEHIPKSRWKLVCYLCKKRVGACIQCANRSCYTAFHVTCAREHGLSLKMRQGAASGELRAFCDKHGENPLVSRAASPAGPPRASTSALAPVPKAGPSTPSGSGLGSYNAAPSLLKLTLKLPSAPPPLGGKSARAYKTTFARAPPVVPLKLAERIVAYLGKIKLPGKKGVVDAVCRYWSLKREARRGAPLLKRIHLEPWTASATTRQQSEADKAHKLALLRLVRNDLEKVRMLTELVRKRERKKLERAAHLRSVVEGAVFPLEGQMRDALQAIQGLDKQHYFARPVDRAAVPDYYDVIHYPMDWSTMGDKLARHEYLSGLDFAGDVRLVINNARRYNTSSSTVHRAAIKLLSLAEPLLAPLESADAAAAPPVGDVLDAEALDALFEFGYDTHDPEGKKARAREERARREAEEEERQAREEEERRAREEAEEEARATRAKGKGKGKGKARAASPDEAEGEQEEEDDAMEVDAPAPAPVQRGKKRSAALAGLDSPAPYAARTTRAGTAAATPKPQPRTTRSGGTPLAAPPPTGAAGKKGKAATPVPAAGAGKKGKGKAKEAIEEEEKPAKKGKEVAILEDVDPKASFKHFETGWVLPEGSRRRSSASASASGTPRTGALALPPTPSTGEPATLAPPPPKSVKKGKGRAVEPVVEEAEEEAKDEQEEEEEEETKPSPAKKARVDPPRNAAPVSPKKGATTGSPQKGGSATPGQSAQTDAEQVRHFEKRMAELHPQIEITPKTKLNEGYLVWARLPPHPFFPAEVVDPDADDTPASIRKNRPAGKDDKVPVMFFDDARSGGWITRNNLRGLADCAEADELLLSRAALAWNRRKFQQGKAHKAYPQMLEELQDAFEWAKENAENTDDEQERLATEKAGGAGAKKGKGKRKAPAGGRKRR